MSKQREEFEAWAIEQGIPLVMSKCLTLDELRPTLLAWKAWQASRAVALEEAADACDDASVYMIINHADGRPSDGAESCAAAIRALKEQS